MNVGTIRFAPRTREFDALRDDFAPRTREFDALRDDFARLAAQFVAPATADRTWSPPVDVFDTPDAVVLDVELPGFTPDDIEIEVDDDVLTIRGERAFTEPEEGTRVTRVERRYGRFAREMTLATGVRTDDIKATFDLGVLRVTIPKAPEVRPRRIAVSSGAAAA
ncbi:MAG: Hsp20/alpha crystallin family protein [Actinobacteria bacterium]|nr:Hsp20/alpha crystallin family protein [Actinomycetota bacterium]